MGVHTIFDQKVADAVLDGMALGKSLRQMCKEIGCVESTVRRWAIEDRNGFRAHYASARELQVDAMADEILEVANDGTNDWMTIQRGGESVEVENREVVNRSRLRVDTMKWVMSKIAPKKYGEKTQHEVTGADGSPLTISWVEPK
jgi:hypothetical protein